MKSEIRDGMAIDWDAPIAMDDGVVLRADVFRPVADGRYPVILSYGPYAKGLAMQEAYKSAWLRIIASAPEVLEGSTNKYQNWELFDPEKWVPDGYVCLRVDSRGAGRSPGFLEVWSPREAQDIAACVEWAGVQPWSNGKVGIHGISYYSMNQWQAAPLRPKHLAALCIWEGSSDYYRELCRHGGILSDFFSSWYPRQVTAVQHGVGERGFKSAVTGEPVAGPVTLPEDELKKNRAACDQDALHHRLIDDYHRARLPKFEDIDAPLLSAANWGGMGLHPRGNFEGFLRAGSKQKWLEVHGDTHFTLFYAKYGQDLQRRFFAHFLKGEDTGWDKQPKVLLNIRHPGEKFVPRAENEWPLARTQWTKFFLRPDRSLNTQAATGKSTLTYETTGAGVTFLTPALTQAMEITGPVAVKLFVSSDTTDADIFLVLRVFDPAGKEVVFVGSNDPRTPVGLGWLRASHRKLDPARSLPYRPLHTHDEEWPLTPGAPVELDIEIWPTCIVVPPGYRIGLTVRGIDYEYDGTDAALPHAAYPMKGVGPFTHTNPADRPPEIFGGRNTLHFGADMAAAYMLLPVIPGGEFMIRAGIVGLGRWGRSLVTSVAGKSDDIRFTLAHTRTRASAEEFCRDTGVQLVDSYEQILRDPNIDAVVLATPHSQHEAQVLAAAAARKHIFVEKPITLDLASARKAVEAVRRAGLVLGVGFTRRFHPSIGELRARLKDGRLGKLVAMVGQHTTSTAQFLPLDNWRASEHEAPGGALTAVGVHSLDHMIEFGGRVHDVHCVTARNYPGRSDDTTTVMLRFESGATGLLFCSVYTATNFQFTAYGTDGLAEVSRPDLHHFRFVPGSTAAPTGPVAAPADEIVEHKGFDMLHAEMTAFAHAIRDKTPYPVPVDDVLHGMAIFDAVVESARTGKIVAVASSM